MPWLKISTKLLPLLLIVSLAGCASTGSAGDSQKQEDLTLRQHLKRISGVNVTGTQENTRITIRASGSLKSNRGKQPLFVVDGTQVGRSFYYVESNLNPEEIVSVEVLRGAGANMYGDRGGQGVIVIETTRDN